MTIWVKLALVGVLLAGLWFALSFIEKRGYDRCEADMRQASLDQATADAKRIKKAEEERDAKQIIIDRLYAQSQRVQVHFPACPSTGNQDGAGGALSQRVDESFGRLQQRTTALFKRCDEMNLDAIKINAEVR